VEAPEAFTGRVLPAEDGASTREPEPLFTYYRSWPDGYYEAYGLRDGRFSLVHHRLGRGAPYRTDLYDLETDPAESAPLAEPDGAVRDALLARLQGWMQAHPAGRPSHIQIDAETLRHLEALGYAQ
jgi:hypothetical protein